MARLPRVIEIDERVHIPSAEIELSYARSGGPGGQHVNKTSTKVLLRWNVRTSSALGGEDRAWLLDRLGSSLTEAGELLVTSERHRDQSRNVDDAVARLAERVRAALRRPRKRRKTRPSAAARRRRLEEKRRRGEVKRQRRPPTE